MTVSLMKRKIIEKKYSKAERAVDRPHPFIAHMQRRADGTELAVWKVLLKTWENKGNKENVKKNCHTITSMVQYK